MERKEMMKLTKVAKEWEFTCSFCFKKFPSAQAMGGHQNAHRSQRLEEKRLFVRDPIGYRKRAFLRATAKADQPSAAVQGGGGGGGDSGELNGVRNYFLQQQHYSRCEDSSLVNNVSGEINPNIIPKERSLAESVGDDARGKACIEFNIAGYGINLDDQKLDLTLKL